MYEGDVLKSYSYFLEVIFIRIQKFLVFFFSALGLIKTLFECNFIKTKYVGFDYNQIFIHLLLYYPQDDLKPVLDK